MGIVCNLPFQLLINNHSFESFSTEITDTHDDLFPSFSIYENEEIEILFTSEDTQAKLYIDALDIVPDGYGISVDENGFIYRKASHDPFWLYKSNDSYDALRVDQFSVQINCNGIRYYGLLNILPKQLSLDEWTIMRDDLEREITGLAQDLVRRNIGLGNHPDGIVPPEKLYNFFVIKKYAKKLLSALIDLQYSPKYRIVTDYVMEENFKAVKTDSNTVKRHLRNGGIDSTYSVPVKRISYDIQENRLLKNILSIYDHELCNFISLLKRIQDQRKRNLLLEHEQYSRLYDKGIVDFIDTAIHLQKITNIIKTQDWYNEIPPLSDMMIPHSFVLDSRYGIIYKMYEELRHRTFNVQMDPNYSYSWKKSSSLYEMWCYIKICRGLAACYNTECQFWNIDINNTMLFPYLCNGAKMVFSDDTIQLEVIFDQFVPKAESKTNLHKNPFYCIGRHTRPDITIDIYCKKNDWYIGSIILECKYRKLSSFWQSSGEWSSKPQIQAYYTENKSCFTYGGLGKVFDIRPIQTVLVLTPDYQGNNVKSIGFKTLIKTLRPEENGTLLNDLLATIQENVNECLKKSIDAER